MPLNLVYGKKTKNSLIYFLSLQQNKYRGRNKYIWIYVLLLGVFYYSLQHILLLGK